MAIVMIIDYTGPIGWGEGTVVTVNVSATQLGGTSDDVVMLCFR